MFDVARGIKALDVSFDVILTSPYARALRTAEILAEVYDSQKLFETAPPGRRKPAPRKIIDEINENFSAAGEIVAGRPRAFHEPPDFDAV